MKPFSRGNQASKDAYNILANSIFLSNYSDDQVASFFANFIHHSPDSGFEQRLEKLISNKRILGLTGSSSNNLESLFEKPAYGFPSIARFWSFAQTLVLHSSEHIQSFVNIREAFEAAFVTGDLVTASRALDEHLAKVGESIWYFRSKIQLLAEHGSAADVDAYCSSLKARCANPFSQSIITYFQVISQAENAIPTLKSIQSNVAEFHEGKHATPAAVLTQLFLRDSITPEKIETIETVESLQNFSLIDLYHQLVKSIIGIVSDARLNGTAPPQVAVKFLKSVNKKLNDPVLRRIESELDGSLQLRQSPEGLQLLEKYDSGNYKGAIEYFRDNLSKFDDPLAYVPLVAKARAIHKRDLTSQNIVIKNASLEKMISRISEIYQLSPDRARIEESIVSSAAKIKHLFRSSQLYAALVVAMPYRFQNSEVQSTAIRALLSCNESTPYIKALCAGPANEFGNKYGVENHAYLTPYRRLKRDICSAVKDGKSLAEIDRLLKDLHEKAPLKKDYFELLADFCLHRNLMGRLLSETVIALVSNPNSYICFPMTSLIDAIEKLRPGDLNSVLIAYYYHRYVSPHKDYVLNESFEEYLIANNVTLPSELLSNKNSLSQFEIVFFRDVCNTDVLDFLPAFLNANELRAERIRILDQLVGRKAMESAPRIKEVEEMVTKAFVDARTVEFTRWKIAVNDSALRDKCKDSIAPLLRYFRNAPDENENSLRLVKDSSGTGAASYPVGSKNTTISRIYDIVKTAFLFDENHGLDKTLSTEIRHGFFSGLIRSCLEDHHLITEQNEKGVYKENEYWKGKHDFLIDAAKKNIDARLQTFSAKINLLIAEAEEWMKIETALDQPNRIFKYPISNSEFKEISSMAERSKDPNLIIGAILNNLWERTDNNLASIRDRINVQFRNQLMELLKELESAISKDKGNAALLELMGEIASVKGEINEEVSKAAEWFNRAPDTTRTPAALSRVLEIALKSFREIKRPHVAPTISVDHLLDDLIVSGEGVKPLTISMINLLDNCYRHSGLFLDTAVDIVATKSSNGASIKLTNNLSDIRLKELSASNIQELKKKISDPESAILARLEGGTGLPKVARELSTVPGRASLEIGLEHAKFFARITYVS